MEHDNRQEPIPAVNEGQPIYGFSESPAFTPVPPRKHSGPGIASFILAMVMGLLYVGMIVAAIAVVVPHVQANQSLTPQDFQKLGLQSPLIMIGMGMLAAIVGNIIGLVLGIIGLLQKERKKGFAIAGTVMNGLAVLVLLLLVLVSLTLR
jgi:hypothetical protein